MADSYDTSVFINCPFDREYRPLFEAVTFAAYDCGFAPRSSLEVDDSTEVRIVKITGIIRQCQLAIHDISRTQVDRTTGLPRFNMPLELGIFLGAKAFGSGEHRRKVGIVLDTELHRYHRFISDIAGQDIRAHGGRPDEAIRQVREFLSTHCKSGVILPGGDKIVERYRRFRRMLPTACRRFHLTPSNLNFRDLSTLIVAWLQAHPLSSQSD
jgi:hypothetical protein